MTIVAKVIVTIYPKGGEEDNDPRDGDFMPDEGEQGKGKGKGKGRGKGKRAAS